MNAVNFLRYLKGYLTFRGEGGFTERFINLCNRDGIIIRDVVFSDNHFTAECSIDDYKKLRHIGKKSGVKLYVIRREGLIFELKNKRERKGLIFGFVFFVMFFLIMSNFVWTVDVEGNTQVAKEDIINLGKSYGIFVGTYTPTYDETASALALAMESDGVFDWAAINIKGSRAVIEVREKKKSIRSEDTSVPSNLVADFDGVIISAEVFAGTGYIKEGMGIREGDLLISGAEENEDLSVSFVEAKGRITATREKTYTLSFDSNAKVEKIISSETNYFLYLFGLKIPMSISRNPYESFFTDEYYLSYNGIRLPVGIITKTYCELHKEKRNEKECLLSSLESFSENSFNNNRNTLLLSAEPEIRVQKDRIVIDCRWNCLDFMGKNQKIITES